MMLKARIIEQLESDGTLRSRWMQPTTAKSLPPWLAAGGFVFGWPGPV